MQQDGDRTGEGSDACTHEREQHRATGNIRGIENDGATDRHARQERDRGRSSAEASGRHP
jgi:hypothetical protein